MARLTILGFAVFLITAALGAQAAAPVPLSAELRAWLPALTKLMRDGIETKKPNGGVMHRRKDGSVFDGSFDYHSCIIAHWSLLTIARREHDAALETWVLGRLTDEALDKERKWLASRDSEWFFFPYAPAWLVLLLSEVAQSGPEHAARVRGFRLELEGRLFDWLESTPLSKRYPSEKRGGKPFNGFYKSWLMGYLLLQLSEPISRDAEARLAKLRATQIEPERKAIAAHTDHHPLDFLWIPALLAVIDRTAPGKRADSDYAVPELIELPEQVPFRRVHLLGRELSKLWPLACDAQRNDDARSLWHARLTEYRAHEKLWNGSFSGITHWIPQYLWFGMWLAGR